MSDDMGNKLRDKIKKQLENPDNKGKRKQNSPDRFMWILIIVGLLLIFQWVFSSIEETSQNLTYKGFYDMLESNPKTGDIITAIQTESRISGTLKDGKRYYVNIPAYDEDLMRLLKKKCSRV